MSGPRLQKLRHQSGPPGLVGGSDTPPRVAIKVLVEVEIVTKLLVLLQLRIERIDLALAGRILQKDGGEPVRQFLGYLIDGEIATGPRRTLDAKVVPVVVMEFLQRLDEEKVDRKPDRASPVRIATKQPGP